MNTFQNHKDINDIKGAQLDVALYSVRTWANDGVTLAKKLGE